MDALWAVVVFKTLQNCPIDTWDSFVLLKAVDRAVGINGLLAEWKMEAICSKTVEVVAWVKSETQRPSFRSRHSWICTRSTLKGGRRNQTRL